MKPMRGIVVCVNYDDLLNITLVRNARHFVETLVVTHPSDERTKAVVAKVPNARVYETDAFYRYGAKFNKGLAMEEGFDVLGRSGWICIWDADTLFPDSLPLEPVIGCLYTPYRRILADPRNWHTQLDWSTCPLSNDRAFPGYFQLFHADDPVIRIQPWYDVTFAHAGGCDGYFQNRWDVKKKIRPKFEVLHLGPRDANWFGRASRRADSKPVEGALDHQHDMEQFLAYKGWHRQKTVKEFKEHVDVPGIPASGYRVTGRGESQEQKLPPPLGQPSR